MKGFFEVLDEIIDNRVKKVITTYKDRLSRNGFELFKYLLKNTGGHFLYMALKA